MKHIRLTNDCQFFSLTNDQESITLTWNLSINLSEYKCIALREVQLGPLIPSRRDYMIKMYTNMISRTLYNPLREISKIQIPRNTVYANYSSNPGAFPFISEYSIFLLFQNIHE